MYFHFVSQKVEKKKDELSFPTINHVNFGWDLFFGGGRLRRLFIKNALEVCQSLGN